MTGSRSPGGTTIRVLAGFGVAIVGVVLGVALPGAPAHACSCQEQSFADFEASSGSQIVAAFVGSQVERVVEDDQRDGGAILTFDVSRVYAGDVGATYVVRTHAQGSACGLDFTGVGDVAVVAFDRGRGPAVDLCSSTFPEPEIAAVFGAASPAAPIETVPPPDDGAGAGTFWLIASTGAAVALIGGGLVLSSRRAGREGSKPPA